MRRVRATQGYEEQAAELVQRYEALDFADKHRALLDLIPAAATDALNVGAGTGFGLLMLSAVWMHLDAAERSAGMARVASLLGDGGVLLMTLRHGAVPLGRIMFEMSADETIALARASALRCVADVRSASLGAANRAAGVTWSQLAFRRGTPPLH